jgi:hypothetical protein
MRLTAIAPAGHLPFTDHTPGTLGTWTIGVQDSGMHRTHSHESWLMLPMKDGIPEGFEVVSEAVWAESSCLMIICQ